MELLILQTLLLFPQLTLQCRHPVSVCRCLPIASIRELLLQGSHLRGSAEQGIAPLDEPGPGFRQFQAQGIGLRIAGPQLAGQLRHALLRGGSCGLGVRGQHQILAQPGGLSPQVGCQQRVALHPEPVFMQVGEPAQGGDIPLFGCPLVPGHRIAVAGLREEVLVDLAKTRLRGGVPLLRERQEKCHRGFRCRPVIGRVLAAPKFTHFRGHMGQLASLGVDDATEASHPGWQQAGNNIEFLQLCGATGDIAFRCLGITTGCHRNQACQ